MGGVPIMKFVQMLIWLYADWAQSPLVSQTRKSQMFSVQWSCWCQALCCQHVQWHMAKADWCWASSSEPRSSILSLPSLLGSLSCCTEGSALSLGALAGAGAALAQAAKVPSCSWEQSRRCSGVQGSAVSCQPCAQSCWEQPAWSPNWEEQTDP